LPNLLSFKYLSLKDVKDIQFVSSTIISMNLLGLGVVVLANSSLQIDQLSKETNE